MKQILGFLLCGALAAGQVAEHANQRYQTEEGRRSIAATLGAHDRDSRQRPRELIEKLNIAPGMTVADIGTGVGYMIPFLKSAVGTEGKVIAEDIFPDFLEQARERAAQDGAAKVEFILGTERDPKLPPASVDLALVLDAYHHFDYPEEMLAGIAKGLKAGGRLAIVEFHREGFRDPKHIRMTQEELIREVERAGFRLLSVEDFLPKVQYLAIFRKK
jgi:ubiquinone/menaquinone biosynthesis C-methylase UbiE